MIPPRTPLCVPHFLEDAVQTYDQDIEILRRNETGSTPLPGSEGKAKKPEPQGPRRVQPRRAAKQKPVNYSENTKSDDESKREEVETPRKRRKTGSTEDDFKKRALYMISSVMKKNVDSDNTMCVFGPRPWTCAKCRENDQSKHRRTKSSRLARDSNRDQPVAVMRPDSEPDPNVKLLLDWNSVSVSFDRVFQVGSDSFTVDICGTAMVMKL